MNLTAEMDDDHKITHEKPGKQLALLRESIGYSQEYVAAKLHLRARIIELLEADDYQQMPEPVFILGYFRAYAKLLEVPVDPLIKSFNNIYEPQKKTEKALWQNKKESHIGEKAIRLVSAALIIALIAGAGFGWQKYKENEQFSSIKPAEQFSLLEAPKAKADLDIKLTDISKMNAIFKPLSSDMTPVRSTDG
ncbi:MAG: helix-turn-helix domain-containing protein [Proteobacteria bacterium]|nr:helix-turn-helix domain-containing protein [Pseudomonadota bacterium]